MIGRVRVRKDLFSPALLDTSDAGLIEIFDDNNDLIAVFGAVADGQVVCSIRGDEDWTTALQMLGYTKEKS